MSRPSRERWLPRISAGIIGALIGCLCFCIGLLLIVLNEERRVDRQHEQAAELIKGMETDSRDRLRQAVATLQPDCSDETLATLRRWVLASEFLGDLGVLDQQGRLICTTTDGLLRNPMEMSAPDAVFVTKRGEVFRLRYNHSLESRHSALRSGLY